MTVKRPRASTHNGRTYAIYYAEPNELKDGVTVCHGLTDNVKGRIGFESGMLPDTEGAIFIHELLHQLLHESGQEIADDDAAEERLVTFLGRVLFAHIRANPDYWKLITRHAWRTHKPSTRKKRNGTPNAPTTLDG